MQQGFRKLLQSEPPSVCGCLPNIVGASHCSSSTATAFDFDSYGEILRKCRNLSQGKRLHVEIAAAGQDHDTFLGNLLVQMYGHCGCVEDARLAFSKIAHKNRFSWSILLVACNQTGHRQAARSVFDKMPSRNIVAWNSMIASCGEQGQIEQAADLFEQAPERDVVSWTSILVAFAQNGHLQAAKALFERMPQRNIVSWNGMIKAYAQNGDAARSLQLFRTLLFSGVIPNKVTLISTLDACASISALESGKIVHAVSLECGIESDTEVATALLSMYGKCGVLDQSVNLFKRMNQRDTVSWTSMLAVLAQNGHLQEAREMFKRIPEPDFIAWNAIIGAIAQGGYPREALGLFSAMDLEGVGADRVGFLLALDSCASIGALKIGREIHAEISRADDSVAADLFIGTALLDMYGKCGAVEEARYVFQRMPIRSSICWNAFIAACSRNGFFHESKLAFERMPSRDLGSWNAMLTAFAQAGHYRNTIDLFIAMDAEGIQHDSISVVAALDACACLPGLSQGRLIHASVREDLAWDLIVAIAALHMYGKCGSLQEARKIFDDAAQIRLKSNAAFWNAMITAYACNGECRSSLELFWIMILEGVEPNVITFQIALAACSHGGLMDNRCSLFLSMIQDFEAQPAQEHYACVIDHLGRGGRIGEAEELLDNMPFQPDRVSWSTLLAACGIHGDVDRGKRAFLQLNPKDPAQVRN